MSRIELILHNLFNQWRNVAVVIQIILLLIIDDLEKFMEVLIIFWIFVSAISLWSKFFIKSNRFFIHIRVKEYNWLSFSFLVLSGFIILGWPELFSYMYSKNPGNIFFFQGIFFVITGIASLPKILVLDLYGIEVSEFRVNRIYFEDLKEFVIENGSLKVSNGKNTFTYELGILDKAHMEDINRHILKFWQPAELLN